MFVIVDDGGRVAECGDGCLLDDRVAVEVPEGWDARYMHDWVLEGGRLVLQPVEDETALLKAQIKTLEQRVAIMESDMIAG